MSVEPGPGLPPPELCDCESMAGRFGGHRPECPWQIAFKAQVAAERADQEDQEDQADEYESYHDRRDRDYLAHQAHRAGLLKEGKGTGEPETEGELREVLNREDELAEPEEGEAWNEVVHEVVVRFRWSQVSRYTESAMESIDMVDEDPIGTSFDAFLEPHFDTDSFEVLSKSHRVEYEDENRG